MLWANQVLEDNEELQLEGELQLGALDSNEDNDEYYLDNDDDYLDSIEVSFLNLLLVFCTLKLIACDFI